VSKPEEHGTNAAEPGQESKWPPVEDEYHFDFDRGGVPGYLVLIYVAFLIMVFFYVVDNLVPAWWSLDWHINP